MMTESELLQQLADAERWLTEARENLDRWQGYVDSLRQQLCDLSGADSNRFVAVR